MSTLQETAYETGRHVGRVDRHFGIYAPRDYKAWLNIPGFMTGYDMGWTEPDRLEAQGVLDEQYATDEETHSSS